MRIKELLLYRNMEHGEILCDMAYLMERESVEAEREKLRELLFDVLNRLLRLADEYGLEGNLWQAYITLLLVKDENPYSMACELRGAAEGSLSEAARHDFEILRELFFFDLRKMAESLDVPC